jgi:hypothetical protein
VSHFTVASLKITNAEALLAALDAMGFGGKVEVHASPVPLMGYDGATRELDGRAVTAEIIIRRQHLWRAANDIGFARAADGTYTLYLSEYDRRVQPDWQTRLLNEVGIVSAVAQLKKLGASNVTVKRTPKGAVVQAVRYA